MLEKFKKKPKLGRPPLPPEEKKRYSRVALYPETREKIKSLSDKANLNMVDFVDAMVGVASENDNFYTEIITESLRIPE